VTGLLLAACGSSAPVEGGKVFALTDVGESTSSLESDAGMASVVGLAFRTSWKVLEPGDGTYDWSALDAALDIVRARGKQLTLHVGVSSLGLPSWLVGLGAATYTYSGPAGAVTEPIPWDPLYLTRYTRLVSALGARVRARGDLPLLYAVSDGAPVAEVSLVGCRDGTLSGGIAYDRGRYLDAWKTTVEAHAAAFPDIRLFVSAPVAVICLPDADGKVFYSELMAHALARHGRSAVFAADLNELGSSRMAQVDPSITARAAVGFQTIGSSTQDPGNRMQGTLKDAACRGLGVGARYFELYKADLQSTDAAVQEAIRLARAGDPC
jgi:hypothetical protein